MAKQEIKAPKKVFVTLKTKQRGEGVEDKKRKFEEQIALKLLSKQNARWQLADDNYTFNGLELTKKAK